MINRQPQIRFLGLNDDWEQRKLSDIYKAIGNAFVGTATPYYVEEGHFYLESNNIKDGQINHNTEVFINDEFYEKQKDKWLHTGDMVMVQSGHVGHAAVIPEELDCSAAHALIMFRNPKVEIEPYFLNYQYQTTKSKKKIENITTGNTIKHILASEMQEFVVDVTSYGEQKKIARFFRDLDNLITLHQRKCDKLINIKKSMLEKMFPQKGEKTPEIRFSGFTDDWEQRKLSEIATMHARIGWQNLRTSEFLDQGNYMLITGTDFDDGKINYATCHYVEKERYDQDPHIQISNGSILITKDGTLGKVAYVQGLKLPATLNAGVFNVEIRDKNSVDGKYLFQYLKAPFLMDYVGQKATGGTIKHLNQNILVDFPVVLPEKAEQEKIGRYLEGIDNLITLHQRKLEKLIIIKKSMLEKMFV
ncbi:MAG: restriction endonuclease subunit S [Butyrivibrio hungatei]|nr:restriction endonuclease subunit S [Butyrivibrio hungatei]